MVIRCGWWLGTLMLVGCSTAVATADSPVETNVPARRSSITVEVRTQDGKSAAGGVVELFSHDGTTALDHCDLGEQSTCALSSDYRGFGWIEASAPAHRKLRFGVVLTGEAAAFGMTLGTGSVDPKNGLALRVEEPANTIVMKPGDDGRLQASVDSKTPVRFRVQDLETNEAIDLLGTEVERGEDGGYWSVASPVDGRVLVSVDASDFPPQGRPSSLQSSPEMSVAAQTSAILRTLAVARARALERALSVGPGAPVDTKARDDAEDFFARMRELSRTTKDGEVREVALLAALSSLSRDDERQGAVADDVLAGVSPTTKTWSFDETLIVRALSVATAEIDAYGDAAIEGHPNIEIAGRVLLARLRNADERGAQSEAREIYATLQGQRFEGTDAESSAYNYDPDRLIQKGAPLPAVTAWKLRTAESPAEAVDWTARMKGQVFALDLWGTWCKGCVMVMPEVHEVYEAYHSRGFEILSIAIYDSPKVVKAFRAKWPMPWVHAFARQSETTTLFEQFGQRLPRLILVDGEGIIRAVDPRWDDLSAELEQLLPPAPSSL